MFGCVILTNTYRCTTPLHQDIEWFHNHSCPPRLHGATVDLFTVRTVLSLQDCHVNAVTEDLAFECGFSRSASCMWVGSALSHTSLSPSALFLPSCECATVYVSIPPSPGACGLRLVFCLLNLITKTLLVTSAEDVLVQWRAWKPAVGVVTTMWQLEMNISWDLAVKWGIARDL